MTASFPIGSLKGVTSTSAPVARAAPIAASRSFTKYPVLSVLNGYGTGVWKPKTERFPTGVDTACHRVLLGVGVTVITAGLEAEPPNVARRLATNRATSDAAT